MWVSGFQAVGGQDSCSANLLPSSLFLPVVTHATSLVSPDLGWWQCLFLSSFPILLFPPRKNDTEEKRAFLLRCRLLPLFLCNLQLSQPEWGDYLGTSLCGGEGGVRSLTSCISAPLNKEPKLWWVICRQFRTHLVTKMISLGHRSLHFSASKPSFSCRLPLSIGLEGCKQTLQKLHPQGCFAPLLHLGPDGSVLCNTLVLCVLLPCLTPPPISHRGRAI